MQPLARRRRGPGQWITMIRSVMARSSAGSGKHVGLPHQTEGYGIRPSAAATCHDDAMMERLDEVWITRDYPVLCEVTRRIDAGDFHVHQDVVAEATHLEPDEVKRAAAALERRGLVTLAAGMGPVRFAEVSGEAYLITGLHPDADDALSRLVQLLQQAAEQTGDKDERSRLRRAADGLLGVSRDVMTGVLTAYLSAQLPH